jgi:hypothetical protein
MDVPRAAEPLYGLPPSRFTAERNALAKALAARQDRAAETVRKLPRPVGLAWVLNRLAHERPRELAALVASGDRLRAGQRRALSGAGAGELRTAEEELRARARALRAEGERILAAEGRPASPTSLARLELLLRVAAPIRGAARDALVRGVLAREPEIAPGELAGFAVLPGGRGAPSPREPDGGSGRSAPPGASRARARADERRTAAREARRQREHPRATAAARREAEAARARAEREERAAAVAARRAHEAQRRAADARAVAERLAARLRELERGA